MNLDSATRNRLFGALHDTHKIAAMRDNASKMILDAAWESNGHDLSKSIMAAMCSLGGRHAPIKQTYVFLRSYMRPGISGDERLDLVSKCLLDKEICHGKVPGFGSSFVKGQRDDMLDEIKNSVHQADGSIAVIEVNIHMNIYRATGKTLYPNLAFYTAITMLIAGFPLEFCESIMISARVDAWIKYLISK